MTHWPACWLPLAVMLTVATGPIPTARAGDAYRPTPATATPAKPSKDSVDVQPSSDETTVDETDDSTGNVKPAHPAKANRGQPSDTQTYPGSNDDLGPNNSGQGPASNPASQGTDSDEGSRAEWRAKAREADQRIAAAQVRLSQAQSAYTNMRMRSYPSGDSREAIIKEVDDAKAELAASEAARVSLEDEAREAGVPPSWVMP